MAPEQMYPFLNSLLSPFWKRHQKTLGLMIAAIAVTGQARSFAISTTVARWMGTRLDSAVNRFYRLLRNARIDYTVFASQLLQLLQARHGGEVVLAVDWTEWHHGLRMLVAGAVTGKRGIPVFAHAFPQRIWRRSQNSRENTFLRVLVDACRRAGVLPTILCDRGFRRASWLKLLQDLNVGFVVRLMDDVTVELVDGEQVQLKAILLTQGRVLDLGVVPLRQDGRISARVIGYWAPGAHEPWWIATHETISASAALRLYDRRMTIEECFRDTKGRRFGVKLFWTQFRDPEALARFVMLLAVAILIWISAGVAATRRDPSLRLVCRKKGPRQSYVTIGLRVVALERIDISWTSRAISMRLEKPHLRNLGRLAVGGK